ncbi:MAG: hypothetical protein DRP54_06030 [Spirochaetes bacterium]|nr:MAG: hypothetical protein DRP54_06030 [Spirochaetota bacterium]
MELKAIDLNLINYNELSKISCNNSEAERLNRVKTFSEMLSEKLRECSKNETESPEKERYKKKLLDVCHQMEAIFINIMLKSMRKTINETGFMGDSLAKDIFSDMLYEEYSKIIANSDQIGIGKLIYKQLRENI